MPTASVTPLRSNPVMHCSQGIVEVCRLRRNHSYVIRLKSSELDKHGFWFDGQSWAGILLAKSYRTKADAWAALAAFILTHGWPPIEVPF